MRYQFKVCHHYDIKYREATCIRCGERFLYCPICADASFCEECERKVRKERIEKMKKLLDNSTKNS
jgi:PHP family Zn ribbon phosphoesterase